MKIVLFIINVALFFFISTEALAVGTVIAGAVLGAAASGTFLYGVIAFGVNMVVSAVISKVFAPNLPNQQDQPNPGNPTTLPAAGDNKLPVVYGTSYVGGIITDLSITSDNQNLYYCISLCEVTNTETGGTPDVLNFGKVYYGGKLCIFSTVAGEEYKVLKLRDESIYDPGTGAGQEDVSGNINIYLYRNGVSSQTNSGFNATQIMQSTGLIYKWDSNQQMTNCAFAIVNIKYNASRNITQLQQLRVQVINPRSAPGDCFLDYLTSTRYGAAIPLAQIDTASLTALNTYSNELITYSDYAGGSSTIKRFEFNGVIDTNQKIMPNIQLMANCSDCLVRYNEILSLWSVITQKSTYTVAMNINNSNMISALQVTPIDTANAFNVVECKFPDGSQVDSFSSVTYDLAVIKPELLYPNEPVNKQSISLNLTNNNVQAQYITNRLLEAVRDDLQVQCEINYVGLQLEAGDIVTVTNSNYGWVAKLFRIIKVTEKISDQGQVSAALSLSEFNPTVYDDKNITAFEPIPNTGIPSPTIFGTVPAPVISTAYPTIANPAFSVSITTSTEGIIQYAEVWYSAYQYPTSNQLIFAGTSAINPNGDPYGNSEALTPIQLFDIPAGDWYFFTRMVNSLASSNYSLASAKFQWRPRTFQYTEKYLAVAYADNITGTSNFSLNPANRLYFGLYNTSNSTAPTTASLYSWYLAEPAFGSAVYLAYSNRQSRRFSFDTSEATFAGGGGAFVPTNTIAFSPLTWASLPSGKNIIDLDIPTGQVISTGSPGGSSVDDGILTITNTDDGRLLASLDPFLSDFVGPEGTITLTTGQITIDKFGRIRGITPPDSFFMTIDTFTATSGQTIFTPATRNAEYITGQDLIFKNGSLLSTSDYTETSTTFTLLSGATTGDILTCVSMRATASSITFVNTGLVVSTVATTTVTWAAGAMPHQLINAGDKMTFLNTGTPTQYTVARVDYTTRQIVFTASVTSVSAGAIIYTYRALNSSYPVFSRFEDNLSNTGSYLPTTWQFQSGYELPFVNGSVMSEQDYDIVAGAITNFPATTTGKLVIIQFSQNNLVAPTGSYTNLITYSVDGQLTYTFTFTLNALNVYANGILLKSGTDYTESTNNFTLATAITNITTILQQQTFARLSAA
jgi:hypothetical protein